MPTSDNAPSPVLPETDSTEWQPDPVLISAWKEARLVFGVLLAAGAYTVIVCGWMGYGRKPDSLKFVFGFPDWIFWGIVVPWGTCIVLSTWLGATFFRDDDLGDELVESERLAAVKRMEQGKSFDEIVPATPGVQGGAR